MKARHIAVAILATTLSGHSLAKSDTTPHPMSSEKRASAKSKALPRGDRARFELERALTCEKAAKPSKVIALIERVGGVPIIQSDRVYIGEYTIPDPLDILGRPVTRISIRKGRNQDGYFPEYVSRFEGESIHTIATFAEIPTGKDGVYLRKIRGRDLGVRSEVGATYVVCANEVRTIRKALRRMAESARAKFTE